MTLKPFTATLSHNGERRTIEIWTATLKAARESAESFARDEGWPPATKITVIKS